MWRTWTGAFCAMLFGLSLLLAHQAYGRQPATRGQLNREKGNVSHRGKKAWPRCIWKQWHASRHAKPNQDDCMFPPCEYEGSFEVQEVDLDGNRMTREFILRYPVVPTGGTAERNPFGIEQVTKGRCKSLMDGNGELAVLKARDNGYRRLFHWASIGGGFCGVVVHGWDGKQYKVLEESEDVPGDEIEGLIKRQGPVHLVSPRP